MKQALMYFMTLLEKDLLVLLDVGKKVKEHRREIDSVEYKALKNAFLIRVSQGALVHIRMIIEDFDYNIGAWQKLGTGNQDEFMIPQVHLDKIALLNRAKSKIIDSKIESKLSGCTSIGEAQDALTLAISLIERLEDLLKDEHYLP